MRQGNGTDLLGANDPRAASIGIIYVAPNDDRTSVLAAILTQEKLGRKQVAVVLPNPNKAFQRPVDFEDLKAVRRKLQVNVVFIAEPGPGPAEFARQRRFPVYSSPESYAEALREQDSSLLTAGGTNSSTGEKKGFWPFGRQKNGVTSTPPASVGTPPPPEEDDEEFYDEEPEPHHRHAYPEEDEFLDEEDEGEFFDEEDEDERDNVSPLAAGAAGVAAGFALSDFANTPRPPENHVAPVPANATQAMNDGGATQAFNLNEDADALPPASAPAAGSIPIRAGTSVPDPAPIAGRQTSVNPAPNDDIVEEASYGSAAAAADEPIILGQRKGPRNTAELPPDPQPVPSRTSRRASMAAPATAGVVAAGLASTPQPVSASASTRTPPSVPLTPRGVPGGGSGGNGPRRRGRSRMFLGLALLLLTALLVCASLAYAQPHLLSGIMPNVQLPGTVASAKISIMPASQVVSNNYVITGVSGTPDPKQQTIKARSLSGSAQSQRLAVTGSGHNQTAGKAATGTLTFYNLNPTATTIRAHTVLTTDAGIQLWNNTSVTIPAGNLPTAGSQDVAATVLSIGTKGNIAAGTINSGCCAAGVAVKNLAGFSGGQDPANYNFVTQDDVSAVATQQVQNQIAQQAVNQLKGKLAQGELFAQSPQCQTGIVNSTPIGDHGTGYNSSTVTVSTNCTSVAYDDQGMRSLVTQLLTQKAQISPGAGYTLQANRIIIDPKIQSADPVSLNVSAKGQWVYQFSDQQQTALANLVKGKSVSAATTLLRGTKGIANVTIQYDGSSLPTDPNQISFVIESPTALSGGSTGPGASPTVTIATTPVETPSSGVGRG
ncbi:MAG TPA: hypothetical protein VL485_30345 [Ktedonobacteraceae bacterium]|nr:hypothetical protein [Ktedonobacteraceae bacterium]